MKSKSTFNQEQANPTLRPNRETQLSNPEPQDSLTSLGKQSCVTPLTGEDYRRRLPGLFKTINSLHLFCTDGHDRHTVTIGELNHFFLIQYDGFVRFNR